MSYPGGYPGQPSNQPYQGGPQGGYPGAGSYQGAPQQGGYPGAAGAPGAPYQQQPGAPYQQQPGAPYQQQPGYNPAAAMAPPQQQPAYGAPSGVAPEVMSWFRAVDQDNSGFINAQELSQALQSGNNRNFSVQACATMMGLFDHQRTGRIDVNQFAQLYAFINQWTEAFRRADSDRSGSITVNEMLPVLLQQGYNLNPQTVQLMVQKFGQQPPPAGGYNPYQQQPQPPTLGLDGFILVNVQLKRLTDAFRQKDMQQQGRITISYEDFIGLVVNTVA